MLGQTPSAVDPALPVPRCRCGAPPRRLASLRSVLIAGFPAGPWGTNCYVAATGPGSGVRDHRPGQGRRPGRGRGRRASTGSSPSPSCSPTATSTTCGASRRCAARTTSRPGSTPRTGTCWPNPMAGMSAETTAMLLGGKYEFGEPDDVTELDRRPGARAGRPGPFTVDHTPGHTRGSVTFRTPYDAEVTDDLRGHVLRRPALRRLHRTHRPARRRPSDDAREPAHQGADAPDDIVVLPGHGHQTTIGRERATNPFLLELLEDGAAPRVTRGL